MRQTREQKTTDITFRLEYDVVNQELDKGSEHHPPEWEKRLENIYCYDTLAEEDAPDYITEHLLDKVRKAEGVQ